MPFTKEEFEAWHEAKLKREWRPTPEYRDPPIATCIHCHRTFGISEGVITDGAAICDICNRD